MDLPEPVGPTIATVRPAGTSKVTPDSVGRSVPVEGEADVGEADARAAGGDHGGVRAVRRLARRLEHRQHPVEAGQRARQVGEHPADGADGQREQA